MLYYKLNTTTGEVSLGNILLSDVSFTAGNGLSVSGDTISVNVDGQSLEIVSDSLQAKLNGSGAIVKNSSGLRLNYDSSKFSIIANVLKLHDNYATRNHYETIYGNGTKTNFDVTHSFASLNVTVEVWEVSTKKKNNGRCGSYR